MKTVFVAAGHSDADPGAVAQGRREADIALDMRNMVALYLERAAVPYGMDGRKLENLPLKTSVAQAKKYDIAVEFHCNAGAPAATGVEVLSAAKDRVLAAKISAAIAKALGIRDRGAKPENAGQHPRLAFISDGKGMIVELFFITNKGDLAAWDAKKWLAAKAVADILIREAKHG